jgi:hypothetical protein
MIQPKPKRNMRNLTVSVPEDELVALDDYCRFLGGATDRAYVVTEALRAVIRRDKRFKKAQASDPPNAARKAAGA